MSYRIKTIGYLYLINLITFLLELIISSRWTKNLGTSIIYCCFVVVQSPTHVQFFGTPWTVACQAPLSSTISWSLLKFMSIKSVMLSNHLILWDPLLLLSSILPSIRVFSNKSALCIKWPKYWSFSFSIPPSNEYFFRTDWFDLLAVQETLKSFLQHHNLKASILQCSDLFTI